MPPLKLALALIIAIPLMGCAGTPKPASVLRGECKMFAGPEYAPKSKDQRDQSWIDETVEVGVSGCGWVRPKARPAEAPVLTKPALRKKGWKIWRQRTGGV